jgi:hypothetical protein
MDRTVTFKEEETSGYEPQPGLDTTTDRLTDPQSQCDFDFVEAGSNTFTVALRVVGGDKKGCLVSETVKYGREYHGTRTRE